MTPPKSVWAKKQIMLAYEDPSGKIQEVPAIASISIDVGGEEGNQTFNLSGCGINRASFADLESIWDTFCNFWGPKIQLDNYGNELVRECLKELGFVAPKPY